MPIDVDSLRRTDQVDGAVHLPQALDAPALALPQAAFDWSVAHPGAASGRPFEGTAGAFHRDRCNPGALANEHHRRLLHDAPPVPAHPRTPGGHR